jgi:hypothetical protein
MPLVGSSAAGTQTAANPGNANNDPLYPVGDTTTAMTSFIYGSPALKFDPGGITLLGEIEYVDVFHVTRNANLLAPGRTRAASTFDVEVEPAYFEVLPNLELQFPVSVTYNFLGNSQMDTTMNNGTGSVTASIVATYRENWDASFNYVAYFGRAGTNPGVPHISANASDRSYVSLNLQHTF